MSMQRERELVSVVCYCLLRLPLPAIKKFIIMSIR